MVAWVISGRGQGSIRCWRTVSAQWGLDPRPCHGARSTATSFILIRERAYIHLKGQSEGGGHD